MRISTNEFLLGSLNELLAQQENVNQLNREIASGETMLSASSDPGGAGQVVGLANQIGQLTYDAANGQAANGQVANGQGANGQPAKVFGSEKIVTCSIKVTLPWSRVYLYTRNQ